MKWLPIEDIPVGMGRKMFVVKAVGITPISTMPDYKYTTGPWCVFMDDGEFVRWPHQYAPTHFCLLPEEI